MSTLAAGIIESVPRELAFACHQSLAINASKKSSPASVLARPRIAILMKMKDFFLGALVAVG